MKVLRRFFYSFPVWGVLLLILLAPTQYSIKLFGIANLSLVDPLVWVLFLFWFFQRCREQCLLSELKRVSLLVVVWIGVALLSLFRSEGLLVSVVDILQWVEYFLVAYMLFLTALEDRQVSRLATLLFLVTAGAIIFLGSTQYMNSARAALDVCGTFGNKNVFGGFLSLVLPLGLGLLLYEERWWCRAALVSLLLLGWLVNLSGGTAIALLVTFSALASMKGPRALVVMSAVLCFVLVVGLYLPRKNGREVFSSVSLYDHDGEVNTRYVEWQAALAMIQENPLLGVGVGDYQGHIGRYYGTLPDAEGVAEPDSQNLYLVLASSSGILSMLLFLGLLLGFMHKAARIYYMPHAVSYRGLSLGLFGSILAYSINGLWSPLLVRGLGLPLVFLFSLITVATTMADQESSLVPPEECEG